IFNAQNLRKVGNFHHAPTGTVLNSYPHGFVYAKGVVIDRHDSVWVAHAGTIGGSNSVGHLKTDGTFVGNVALASAPVATDPTGVAVDSNGKIWVTNYYTHTVMRIDPALGPIGGGGYPVGAVDLTVDLGAGAFPYNYSDMTGQIAVGNPVQGFWTVIHDGLATGTRWGTIWWNTEPEAFIPAGTEIWVDARAADTHAALSNQTFIPVNSGIPFNLMGRYIEVKASLKSGVSAGCVETPNPIFSDLRIRASVDVCDIDSDGDIDKLDLSLISKARGQTPLPGDMRDANRDGVINAADVKACIPICTRPNCATQ
ncbi:MAG TPA: dockerin type I domain-containing protein, partial [Thiobacillaceae bacterium]|nr:dockerin type I domain-containing protein [Thiobacillaceae bacterium]